MPRTTNRSAVYSHLLRWEPLLVPNSEGRAWIKTLGKDEETGARTALVKFDAGFRQPTTVSTWPADMYVVEGSMRSGEYSYQAGTFHYRPGGVRFGPIESKTGCVRLVMTADSKSKASADQVFIENTLEVPYGKSYIDPTGLVAGIKDLRQDPEAGYSILIHSQFTHSERTQAGQMHVHDHHEEAFVLEGEWEDYLHDVESHIYWMPGMYMCRAPGESRHGDSMALKVPKTTIIWRGWVGQTGKFYDTLAAHSPNETIPFSPFVE